MRHLLFCLLTVVSSVALHAQPTTPAVSPNGQTSNLCRWGIPRWDTGNLRLERHHTSTSVFLSGQAPTLAEGLVLAVTPYPGRTQQSQTRP